MNEQKEAIRNILSQMHPSKAISLIESIGKELRRKNSLRISKMTFKDFRDLERPDLYDLKNK